MQDLRLSVVAGNLHMEGFPDQAKVVALTGPSVWPLADYFLHRVDLRCARACLDAINAAPDPLMQEMIFRAAVIHFMKCFGKSNARDRLTASDVYARAPPAALAAFKYFKALRDKHIAHDENALSQSRPGAILNKPSAPEKVALVACFGGPMGTLSQESFGTLINLIEHARAWVEAKIDAECATLKADLEREPYADLMARGDVTISAIPTAEVFNTRPRP